MTSHDLPHDLPDGVIVEVKVSAGSSGMEAVSGHTPTASPAAIAAPRTVISANLGRTVGLHVKGEGQGGCGLTDRDAQDVGQELEKEVILCHASINIDLLQLPLRGVLVHALDDLTCTCE